MSDSDTTGLPSEAAVSRVLRNTVNALFSQGKTEELTVKRIRARAEKELGLSEGFLKNQEWKQKSSDIIKKEVTSLDEQVPEPAPTPQKATKSKPKTAPKPKKAESISESPRGVKRKAPAPAKNVIKRKKTTVPSDDESDAALSEAESEPPKKPARRVNKVIAEGSDDEAGNLSDEDPAPVAGKKQHTNTHGDVSESEMSSLIDESPVKKSRQKKASVPKTTKGSKAKETKTTKARAKATKDESPDQAEIKRLQGWLVKCGIRKVWSKELAKCDSDKEKIKHLKGMLKEAGMDGKFSVEKAAKIKEEREFAKDLEAIREGEKSWGHVEDVSTSGRPRRRAAQIARPIVVQPQVDSEQDDEEQDQSSEEGSDHHESSNDDTGGSGPDSESDVNMDDSD